MATYSEVTPDVLGIANKIITRYHPPLTLARVGFLFQDEASKKAGNYVLGSASKTSDKERAAGLDYDFIITLAKDMWQDLSQHQREALIDHELCHCDFTQGYARMRGHDIEEFHCIVERYGLWKSDLAVFGQVVEQHLLPGMATELHRMGAVLAVNPAMAMAEADEE